MSDIDKYLKEVRRGKKQNLECPHCTRVQMYQVVRTFTVYQCAFCYGEFMGRLCVNWTNVEIKELSGATC